MLLPVDSCIAYGDYIDQLIRFAEHVDLDTAEYTVDQYQKAASHLIERAMEYETIGQYEECFVWLWRAVHIFRSLGTHRGTYANAVEQAIGGIERMQPRLRCSHELHLLRVQEEVTVRRVEWEKRRKEEVERQQALFFEEETNDRQAILSLLHPILRTFQRIHADVRRAILVEQKMVLSEEIKERLHREKVERERQLLEIQQALHRRNEEKRREQQCILEKFTKIKRCTIPRIEYTAWRYPARAVRVARRGLVNLGNTCFMNSVLQCLQPVQRFRESIQVRARRIGNTHTAPLTNAYAWVAFELAVSTVQYATSPNFIHQIIRAREATFDNKGQHDSHEFLRVFLEVLQEESERFEVASQPQKKPQSADQKKKPEVVPEFHEILAEYCNRSSTIVSRTFGYFERSSLLCPRCGFDSTTYNISFALLLPIPKGARTLHDCLAVYTASEALPQDSGWVCTMCQQKVPAIKQLTFQTHPNVLTITLVRFCMSYETGTYEKNNSEIIYPPTLTLHEHVYDLVAVVNHQGTMAGGHYTADVYHPEDQAWCSFSDERCMEVREPRWSQSYILFYQSRDSSLSGMTMCCEHASKGLREHREPNPSASEQPQRNNVSPAHHTMAPSTLENAPSSSPNVQRDDLSMESLAAWLGQD